MEIKLNVDGGDFSKNVQELLESLTDEQKKDLASQVVTNAINEVDSQFSKEYAKKKALELINEIHKGGYFLEEGRLRYGSGWSNVPDYNIQNQFNDLVSNHNKVCKYFEDVVLNSMLETAKSQVSEMIRNNDKIQTAINTAVQTLESKIPEMVQNAMQQFFVQSLQNMISSTNIQQEQTKMIESELSTLKQTLQNNNIY